MRMTSVHTCTQLLLIVIFAMAPLASNMSLMLNPVSTYQVSLSLSPPSLFLVLFLGSSKRRRFPLSSRSLESARDSSQCPCIRPG